MYAEIKKRLLKEAAEIVREHNIRHERAVYVVVNRFTLNADSEVLKRIMDECPLFSPSIIELMETMEWVVRARCDVSYYLYHDLTASNATPHII